MTARPGRQGRGFTAVVAVALAAATIAVAVAAAVTVARGGHSPSPASVPAVFRPACGHPGASVTVPESSLPVTIPHALCDLTGVLISVPGRGGMYVPDSAGEGVGNSAGLQLTVDGGSSDVHLTATGPAGNA